MPIDDFLYGGSKKFLETVVNKITETYKVGSKGVDIFKYIGLQVTNTDSETTVSQDSHVASLKEIPILPSQKIRKHDDVTKDQEEQLRTVVGQLNWVWN